MKVTNVRRARSYILLSHSNLHSVLSCQPKSWCTVFSGPEGKLAILNPQSNNEQLVASLLSDLTATSEWQLKSAQKKKRGKQREYVAATPLGI